MTRTARGFTLVEVMTVAVIIALILAIMLPTFSRVMDLARETDCRNNLKRLAEIVLNYCQQNNDWLPKNDQDDQYPKKDPNEEEKLLGDRSNLRWWCNKVYTYGTKRPSLYICPSDTQIAEMMIVTSGYGFNDTLTNPETMSGALKGDGCQTLFGVKNSATTALIGHCSRSLEEVDEQPAILEKMAHEEYWPGVHVPTGGPHTGRCGFVLASGAVETFSLKQALQMVDPNGVLLLFHK